MKNLLTNDKNRLNIGKVYFFYLFFALFLQIIGLSGKGGLVDTIWKVGVIGLTLIFVLHKTGWEISVYIAFPLVIYLLGQVIAWIFLPYTLNGSTSAFSSIANVAVVVAMVYLFYSVPSTNDEFEGKDARFLLKAFLILMLYAVVYNFIANPTAVLGFMRNETVYSDMISSFFDNKQTFGMFLLMAVMACFLLYVMEDKTRYIVFSGFFFLNLFICLSRTALLACGVFMVVVAFLMLKPKVFLSKVLFAVFVFVVLVVLLVPTLRIFIYNVVFDTDATVNARTDIWAAAFEMLKGANLVFGFGEANSAAVLLSEGIARYSHNGIVQVLLSGGIVKLILYVIVLVRSVVSYVRIRKTNLAMGNMFIAIMIGIFVYSMGEAIVLFDTSMPCVMATILTVALPICFENVYENKSEKKGNL